MPHEPQVYIDCILDVKKIPSLLAVGVAPTAPEQLEPFAAFELLVQLKRYACHSSLVLLEGTVNIEVPESDDLRAGTGKSCARVIVKEFL